MIIVSQVSKISAAKTKNEKNKNEKNKKKKVIDCNRYHCVCVCVCVLQEKKHAARKTFFSWDIFW